MNKKTRTKIRKQQTKRRINFEAGLCRCGKGRGPNSTQCPECEQYSRDYNFAYRLGLRMEAIAAYGGKCVCCGEIRHEFLEFDHKNNDGGIQRKANASIRSSMTLRLKKNGYPDDIQLLCGNCHNSKTLYGYCPHQEISSKSTETSLSLR